MISAAQVPVVFGSLYRPGWFSSVQMYAEPCFGFSKTIFFLLDFDIEQISRLCVWIGAAEDPVLFLSHRIKRLEDSLFKSFCHGDF
jgi:hypothetical protein